MQEVARRIGRTASTISGSCGATPPLEAAAWRIALRQRNGMPSEPLEQIVRRLPVDVPDDETMRSSHEAIHQALLGASLLERIFAPVKEGR